MVISSTDVNSNRYLVVMSGGMGTRLWPESTTKKPKQYLKLSSDKSLVEETLLRFDQLIGIDNRYVVTVTSQEKLVQNNCGENIHNKNIILEPAGRNTAPCILLSLAKLISHGANHNDVVAIVPADHVILNKSGFQKTIKRAQEAAISDQKIVIIGIRPNFPHTGFGYVQKGELLGYDLYNVVAFKEKPDKELAKKYLASGDYFWNAGMFVGTVQVFLDEFKKSAPDIYTHFDALLSNIDNAEKVNDIYSLIPSDSIDYAVMEKSQAVSVVPAEFDWNDLGSWDALEEILPKKDNNVIVAKNYFCQSATGNIVYAPKKMVSFLDVDDLIVVDTEQTLMILPKKSSQKVKDIIKNLQARADEMKEYL